MEQVTIKELFDGATLVHCQTKRFKTFRMTVRFAVDLKEETVSAFAAVPGLLRYTSAKYPTNMQTERKLASLYGAGFFTTPGKVADAQILSFTLSSVADKFALGAEHISEECLDFLLQAVFAPDLDENGLFKEENLRREKRLMSEAIKADMNDKMSYSQQRLNHELFEGEGAAIYSAGTLEGVEKLEPQEVTRAWQTMLRVGKVMVCTVGDMSSDMIESKFKEAFGGISRNYHAPLVAAHTPRMQPKQVSETQKLEQCKLNLGFSFCSENEAATKLFNMIFGGSFMSKLSKVVREKMSLCYYCSSVSDYIKQVIIVYSGVENANRQKVIDAVCAQLKAIQNGEVSEEEFSFAQKKLKEFFLSFDTPAEIARWYLAQLFVPQLKTPEQSWHETEQVTREDVIALSKTVQLDTVYSLGDDE